MRRRRQPPRAAAHHLFVSAPLHFGRHQRPTAFHTRSALVRTLFVSPAMAASARAPQRQRFGVEALDRRERGFPLRRFVVRCPALPEQPAPARFSLPPFFHASRRFPSCAPSSRPATAGRGDHPQLAQQAKDGVGGASAASLPQAPHAPSTTLRVVPLPRSVSLRGGGQTNSFSRRIHARVLLTNKDERHKEGSGAPRGASNHGRILRRGAGLADKCTQSAPPNLLEARSPFGAPLRHLPERANAPAQPRPRFTRTRGCGRYPHRHSRLSKAPCTPVLMPAGTLPRPPGSEVTSFARRNRTRSASGIVSRSVPHDSMSGTATE